MSEITKPSGINIIWASGGDKIDPGNNKYQTGWAVELPPRQWENFIQNKQDQAIAHINQHGVPVWDSATEYQAGKSYVQGSDGNIYKAITTNSAVNPVTDTGTNWSLLAILPRSTTAQAQGWVDNNSLLTPNLLNQAFKGSNQSTTSTGYQKLPGGLILQWGENISNSTAGAPVTVTLPVTFPAGHLSTVLTRTSGVLGSDANTFLIENAILGSFSVRAQLASISFRWIAVGW